MRSLSAQELLDVWEIGQGLVPYERAISLLSAANSGATRDALVRMPIGERDRRLLRLREQIFGPDLEAVARCPVCEELVETALRSSDIRGPGGSGSATVDPLISDGYSVWFRLPDTTDLEAIADMKIPSEAKDLLLRRCILDVKNGSDPVTSDHLPAEVLNALTEAMERADPHTVTILSLTCPYCNEKWQEDFDILSFFWDEIENWAARTVDEVHQLAMAYGWNETEVLSMSAARRQMYLEKVTE
jgi:hypothetical protein